MRKKTGAKCDLIEMWKRTNRASITVEICLVKIWRRSPSARVRARARGRAGEVRGWVDGGARATRARERERASAFEAPAAGSGALARRDDARGPRGGVGRAAGDAAAGDASRHRDGGARLRRARAVRGRVRAHRLGAHRQAQRVRLAPRAHRDHAAPTGPPRPGAGGRARFGARLRAPEGRGRACRGALPPPDAAAPVGVRAAAKRAWRHGADCYRSDGAPPQQGALATCTSLPAGSRPRARTPVLVRSPRARARISS